MSSPQKRHYDKCKSLGLCPQCGKVKVTRFVRCQTCRTKYADKLGKRLRFYKLSKVDYEAKLLAQEGKCAICHKYMDDPCIDHNHETGEVRKLLCRKCNSCLGLMEENIVWLENMIEYVRGFKSCS
jgi:hypothetical protein